MSEDRFDAIVVGAGPAGSAAAYALAKAGKSVLMIERGDRAGSKNVSGGRLYTYALETLEPGLTARASLERTVTREEIMLLDGERGVSISYADPALAGQAPQSFTVLRSPFDEWFAGEAEEQGAILATGIKVDRLLEKDGCIMGVVAGEDEMQANVVIAADGVNSLLAQQAGLRADIAPRQVGVGVKEVIELPASTIEARFGLAPDEGAARLMLGGACGVSGGGFLYTNRQSISLGAVFVASSLAEHGLSVHQLFQDLKQHPAIRALIEGGQTVEYGAHLVPEAGWKGVPQKIHRPGLLVVGDAAGFAINQGYTVRGMDLAILSGVAAARAILAEEDAAALGAAYAGQLEQVGLQAAMQAAAGFPALMENPRLFGAYPALINDVFGQVYGLRRPQSEPLTKGVLQRIRRHVGLRNMVKDGWQAYRAVK